MPKRLTDTDKWKKQFIKGLDASYKLLWFYILDDCDHAGIWDVDIEVARIRTGRQVIEQDALNQFGDKVVVIDDGKKWFIPDFVNFQYGPLNPQNKVHNSVINKLKKHGFYENEQETVKGLPRGFQAPSEDPKDKDKVKDKDKDTDKSFEEFWNLYPKKIGKKPAHKVFKKLSLKDHAFKTLMGGLEKHVASQQWQKNGGQFIPNPTTWLNQERWNDELSQGNTPRTRIVL